MTTSIHQKYSALYGIEITEKSLAEFMFSNIDIFASVFGDFTSPYTAIKVFGVRARNIEETISQKMSCLDDYKQRVKDYRNEIISYQNNYNSNKEKLSFYLRNPFKYKYILEDIQKNINNSKSQLEYYEKYVKSTEEELKMLTSVPNFWCIFEEASYDAMAEIVSRNELVKYMDGTMWSKMKEHYIDALESGGYFRTGNFFKDGIVVNLINISSTQLLRGSETIAEFIDRLCSIKDADLTIRRHIYERLVGGDSASVAAIIHTQHNNGRQHYQQAELLPV